MIYRLRLRRLNLFRVLHTSTVLRSDGMLQPLHEIACSQPCSVLIAVVSARDLRHVRLTHVPARKLWHWDKEHRLSSASMHSVGIYDGNPRMLRFTAAPRVWKCNMLLLQWSCSINAEGVARTCDPIVHGAFRLLTCPNPWPEELTRISSNLVMP